MKLKYLHNDDRLANAKKLREQIKAKIARIDQLIEQKKKELNQ